jgi:hypothetical protein
VPDHEVVQGDTAAAGSRLAGVFLSLPGHDHADVLHGEKFAVRVRKISTQAREFRAPHTGPRHACPRRPGEPLILPMSEDAYPYRWFPAVGQCGRGQVLTHPDQGC